MSAAGRLLAQPGAPTGRAPAAPPADRNSVQKVCALLRALSVGAPLRLTQLSAATGLNKVTALRILDTLALEGFVHREPDGRGYGPGPEMIALAATAVPGHDLRGAARPSLVRLAALSEDTALLSVRSGVESVCVDRQTGSFPIRANYLDIASRRPLGIGAGALSLLAWLPRREIDAILGVLQERLRDYPRSDPDTIRAEIDAARERGYVLVLDRVVDRMGAVGAAIRNPSGEVVGALSIAALSDRVRDRADRLGEALVREAALVEEALTAMSETDRRGGSEP